MLRRCGVITVILLAMHWCGGELAAQAPPFKSKEWQEAHYPETDGWFVEVGAMDIPREVIRKLGKKQDWRTDPLIRAEQDKLVNQVRDQLSSRLLVHVRSTQQNSTSEQRAGGRTQHVNTYSSNVVSRSDLVLTNIKEDRRVDQEEERVHVLLAVKRQDLASATKAGIQNELASIERNAELELTASRLSNGALGALSDRLAKVDRQIVLLGYLSGNDVDVDISFSYSNCNRLLTQLRDAEAGSELEEIRRAARHALSDGQAETCLGHCKKLLAQEPDDASAQALRNEALSLLAMKVEEDRTNALARGETDAALKAVDRYLAHEPMDAHFVAIRKDVAGQHFNRLCTNFDRAVDAGSLKDARQAFSELSKSTQTDPQAFSERRDRLEGLEVSAILGEVSGFERDKNVEAAYRRLAEAIKRFPSQERVLRNRQSSLRGDLYRNYKHEVKRAKPPRYSLQPSASLQSPLWSLDSVTSRIEEPPMSNSFHLGAYRRVGQRPRDEENLRRGWRATLLGLRVGYVEGRYRVPGVLELDYNATAPFEPRITGGISTLLAETFLIDVGISNPGERPFEWDPATSRLQGALALRLRISALYIDLAALGEWSETLPQPMVGFRISVGAAINFSRSFNRTDADGVNARIDAL
jgi:tetratricopeptide (TPR) repeat protein